jgi:hypothetical protein
MERKNETKVNLQTKQPFIQEAPEGNGWPTPLTDESNPVTYKYTTGKSGSVEGRKVTNVSNS